MSCEQQQSTQRAKETPRYVAIDLYYVGSHPVDISGPVTGYFYHFSPLQPRQPVDPRDAVELLADREFRLAR